MYRLLLPVNLTHIVSSSMHTCRGRMARAAASASPHFSAATIADTQFGADLHFRLYEFSDPL